MFLALIHVAQKQISISRRNAMEVSVSDLGRGHLVVAADRADGMAIHTVVPRFDSKSGGMNASYYSCCWGRASCKRISNLRAWLKIAGLPGWSEWEPWRILP